MFGIYKFISIFIFSISLFSVDTLFASYIPGPTISLTGTTSDVRFDVASPLFGNVYSGAYLDTATRNMRGAFYIRDIGWSLLSTGSYQVVLNCGGQPLGNLSTQCQLTGSGWSENIGELGFSTVRYNPSTGTLSGSITSFVGDLTVEGIYLPLIRAELSESLIGVSANHNLSYSVKGTQRYVADSSWSIGIIPSKNPLESVTVAGGLVGVFNGMDLSLADTYTFEITDPDGGTTRYSGIVVNPATASNSLDSTSGLFIEGFCNRNPVSCIGIYPRTATRLIYDNSSRIADGSDAYNMTLKIRDRYGNIITNGTVEVSYTGTVSEVQLPSKIVLSPYSSFGDTLRIGGMFVPYDPSGNWKSSSITLGYTDITYTVASIAPTDWTNNRVVLDKIVYTDTNGTTTTITDTTPLVFDPPYTVSITPPTDIEIGEPSTFTGSFTSLTLESLNPQVIGLFEIGDGLLARYKDFSTDGSPFTEISPDSSWVIRDIPSSLTFSSPTPSFSFSGIYVPLTAYPEIERVYYDGLVHYQVGGIDVVYPVFSGDQTAEYRQSKVKIIGQSNARGEYGKIGTYSNNRTTFFNALRKNVTLLNRGRTTYADVEYKVVTSDTTITDSDFNSHQTIIAVGADITISDNILKDVDAPLAIVVLTDSEGNGGDIHIDASVTDIHAGLFAERSIFSSSNNQLYIFGSLISANTLGDTAAGICPFYITGSCDAKKYDLENLRSYTGSVTGTPATSPTALKYSGTALIIDYDMRLQTDPPPGIPD